MSKYFGMVQCIDDNIGRLVEHLQTSGRWENTLVIFTSDHGDLCYEHDRLNKGNPYEDSARVPMIVRFPGRVDAGQVYRQPVGTVDLTPTIMGLLDLPADSGDQGRNLSKSLTGVSQTDEESSVTFLRNAGTKPSWVAAIDTRYKLIFSNKDETWLFDAEQDPDELLNFYRRPGSEDISQKLGRALAEYRDQYSDPFFEDAKIAQSLRQIMESSAPKE